MKNEVRLMRVMVIGGAGFIGHHLVKRLLSEDQEVVIYDNFSSGRHWHLTDVVSNPRLKVIEANVRDLPMLTEKMAGTDLVIHLASNPDIARAVKEPDIDFWEGTYLTQNVLEAMRVSGTRKILYSSGSGVYGETGRTEVDENYPMAPISTYGASKLGCEALIRSYCHMFDMSGLAFRFANVVGPRQTHGVAHDFIRRLLEKPTHLDILGDGRQSKSYIHVEDVIEAMLLAFRVTRQSFDVFNVATQDYVTVHQIADLVVEQLGLSNVKYRFSGGDRGWKGDVPIVRFNSNKIRSLGWRHRRSSVEALRHSIEHMIADARAGRFDGT